MKEILDILYELAWLGIMCQANLLFFVFITLVLGSINNRKMLRKL